MIDKDKRFSYREADRAVKNTDDVLRSVIESWTTTEFRKAVMSNDDDWVKEVVPESRDLARTLMYAYSDVSTTYAQVQAIVEDSWKIYHMGRKFPWHGTNITKSDHLHFIWVSFTHHCYLFEERVKKFYSAWSKLRSYLGLPKISPGAHIKYISSQLNKYIRYRGVHTHQWNITHKSYRTYQIVEQLAQTDNEYAERASDFYFESKHEVLAHIASGVGMMAEEFCNLKGSPNTTLIGIVPIINERFFRNDNGENSV